MKANQKYILNKNLDLNNENFLVKKGTLLEITKLFDESDTSIETKVGLKFDKINGDYLMDENIFKNHLVNDSLKLIKNSLFNIGDCVVHITYGICKVDDIWYDFYMKFYLYTIINSQDKYTVIEKEIKPCS